MAAPAALDSDLSVLPADLWPAVLRCVGAPRALAPMRLVCAGWALLLSSPEYWTALRAPASCLLPFAECAAGRVASAQWLARHLDPADLSMADPADPACLREDLLRALVAACGQGHLAAAQWLVRASGAPFLPCQGAACSRVSWGAPRPFALARDLGRRSLRAACANGRVEVAQWLACRFSLGADDVRLDRCGALRDACCGGHLKAARWLAATFDLGTSDARAANDRALRRACRGGHLKVAQWLAGAFAFRASRKDTSALPALREACAHGHLAVARWLVTRFKLVARDVAAGGNLALRGACAGGHLEVARWLARAFVLTSMDAGAADNAALRGACDNGHLDVALWLAGSFALDVPPPCLHALALGACRGGHLEVVRWLAPALARRLGRAGVYPCVDAACRCGRLEVAQWLVARFALTAEDSRAHNHSALRAAHAGGHRGAVLWLVSEFGLEGLAAALDAGT
jgi:hypothetical protein